MIARDAGRRAACTVTDDEHIGPHRVQRPRGIVQRLALLDRAMLDLHRHDLAPRRAWPRSRSDIAVRVEFSKKGLKIVSRPEADGRSDAAGDCTRTSARPRRGCAAICSSLSDRRWKCRSTSRAPSADGGKLTSASIAPCRICAAARASTFSARFARLTSASIIARSTAWVDQRSSHSRSGRPSGARLRAKARTDCVRGAVGSVHVQRQTDDQADDRRASMKLRQDASRSCGELGSADGLGGSGKAPPRIADARPMVLVPTSRPGKLCRGGTRGSELRRAGGDQRRHAASLRSASLPDRPPRTGRSRKRDNCCPAGRTGRAPGCRRRSEEAVVASRADLAGFQRSLAHVGAREPACPDCPRRRGAILRSGQRVDAEHVLALALYAVGPFVPSHASMIRSGLAGCPKLCHDKTQPDWLGAEHAGRPIAGRSAVMLSGHPTT